MNCLYNHVSIPCEYETDQRSKCNINVLHKLNLATIKDVLFRT